MNSKKKIRIKVDKIEELAELNDTKTAKLIWQALPIKEVVNIWGEEIYFPVPVATELENPQNIVEAGNIGYWPQGHAFCIFFGPTPISTRNEIRPASPVCVVGKLLSDPERFKKVSPGETITLEKAK